MKKAYKGRVVGIIVIVLAGLLSIYATYRSLNNYSELEVIHTGSIGISGEKVGKDELKNTKIVKNAIIKFNLMGEEVKFKIKEVHDDYIVIESNYELYDINKKNNLKEYKVYKEKKYQVEYLVPDNSSSFIFYWSGI